MMRSLLLLALLLPGSGRDAAQIAWRTDFDAALAEAAAAQQVVFLALNMDGEKANDRTAEDYYHDKELVALTEHTVNLIGSRFDHGGSRCKRFGEVSCADHQAVDKAIRFKVLQATPETDVVAPQHIWLSPAGEVLLSVPYELPTAQMMWCFVTAIHKVDPESKVKMPKGARAPRRLIVNGTIDPGVAETSVPPMSRSEIVATIQHIRAGLRGEEKTQALLRMVATDDEVAIAFIDQEFGDARLGRRSGQLTRYIRAVGVVSPPSFWVTIERFLTHPEEQVQNEAAVAMEQLAAAKSVKDLRSAFGSEKNVEVRKNLLRAIGVAGAEDKGARSILLKAWQDRKKDAFLARNALLVLGLHRSDKKARAAIDEALADLDPLNRQAVALGLAFARAEDLREALAERLTAEADEETKAVLERCLEVLDGGSLAAIANDYARIGEDRIPRTRAFGKAAEEAVKNNQDR